MADLFHENKACTDESFVDMMVRMMKEQRRAQWKKREEEAREFMSEYIGKNPDELHQAVTGFGELDGCLMDMMDICRTQHISEEHTDEEEDFVLAHTIAMLGAIRHLLFEMRKKEGPCYIHLCDRGCEAVRSMTERSE